VPGRFNPFFHISVLATYYLIVTYVHFFHTLASGQIAAPQQDRRLRPLYLTDKTNNKQPDPIPPTGESKRTALWAKCNMQIWRQDPSQGHLRVLVRSIQHAVIGGDYRYHKLDILYEMFCRHGTKSSPAACNSASCATTGYSPAWVSCYGGIWCIRKSHTWQEAKKYVDKAIVDCELIAAIRK
jgi:hypothetical protein